MAAEFSDHRRIPGGLVVRRPWSISRNMAGTSRASLAQASRTSGLLNRSISAFIGVRLISRTARTCRSRTGRTGLLPKGHQFHGLHHRHVHLQKLRAPWHKVRIAASSRARFPQMLLQPVKVGKSVNTRRLSPRSACTRRHKGTRALDRAQFFPTCTSRTRVWSRPAMNAPVYRVSPLRPTGAEPARLVVQFQDCGLVPVHAGHNSPRLAGNAGADDNHRFFIHDCRSSFRFCICIL